jgi:K+-transporting ATPase KdpF subunit
LFLPLVPPGTCLPEALGGRMEEYALLIIAVILLLYLFYALIRPEKF